MHRRTSLPAAVLRNDQRSSIISIVLLATLAGSSYKESVSGSSYCSVKMDCTATPEPPLDEESVLPQIPHETNLTPYHRVNVELASSESREKLEPWLGHPLSDSSSRTLTF